MLRILLFAILANPLLVFAQDTAKEKELTPVPQQSAPAQQAQPVTPSQQPQVQKKRIYYEDLTEEEQKIWDIGEISTASYVIGGIIGTYPIGLGLGHAIQGRYSSKGWIFTVGEVGSGVVLMAGFINCVGSSQYWRHQGCSDYANTLITLGVVGYLGFRIWEIIDVWAEPPEHNRRYREIRARLKGYARRTTLVVSRSIDTPTLGLRFEF